jgi:hypothetical protein
MTSDDKQVERDQFSEGQPSGKLANEQNEALKGSDSELV